MSAIKTPQLKNLVYDLLTFTDDLTSDGKPQRRSTFIKKHYKGAISLQGKILNALLVGMIPKDTKDITSVEDERIEWINYPQAKEQEGKRIFAEKHTDEEIVLSDKEFAALKYYYQERDEIPQVSMETYEELEKLLGF